MTYAGTVVVTKVAKNVLKIVAPDFDADAEFTVIDLSTYRMEGAQDFTIQVTRTAGSENVISFVLMAGNDGSTHTAIATITAANAWSAVTGKGCKSLYLSCATVGVGNTLTAYIYATIR